MAVFQRVSPTIYKNLFGVDGFGSWKSMTMGDLASISGHCEKRWKIWLKKPLEFAGYVQTNLYNWVFNQDKGVQTWQSGAVHQPFLWGYDMGISLMSPTNEAYTWGLRWSLPWVRHGFCFLSMYIYIIYIYTYTWYVYKVFTLNNDPVRSMAGWKIAHL